MSEPTIRRKFLKSDFDANNNKYWGCEWWEDTQRYVATYGRVGDAGQTDEKRVSQGYVEGKIAEKIKKGYVELDLHIPVAIATTPTIQAPVSAHSLQTERFVEYIFREANEHVKTYLATSVDALSQRQIEQGRLLLKEIVGQPSNTKRGYVQSYYNTIPTIMDRRPDVQQLVDKFDPEEQEDRLNQLEAALSTYQAQQAAPTGTSQYDLLGAEVADLLPTSEEYKLIAKQWQASANSGHVTGIYKVLIPKERASYEAEAFGAHIKAMLWHGTRGQNVRHILKSGIRIPDISYNGAMFGRGAYFADEARKSQGYTSARYGDNMMFLGEIKVGDSYIAKEAYGYKEAPKGYHSVMGKAGYTKSWGGTLRMNEFICYRTSQITLKYIVTYR